MTPTKCRMPSGSHFFVLLTDWLHNKMQDFVIHPINLEEFETQQTHHPKRNAHIHILLIILLIRNISINVNKITAQDGLQMTTLLLMDISWFSSRLSSKSRVSTQCNLQNIDDLVQDCGNSIALAVELMQSCIKPSICCLIH